MRLLKLDGEDGLAAELAEARTDLATAALATLEGKTGRVADHWRYLVRNRVHGREPSGDPGAPEEKRSLGLAAIRRQRKRLEELRNEQRVGADAYMILQEELDFTEVALTSESERRIEEG